MKTVYFVRHGESTANLGEHFVDDDTAGLTERGREQACIVAERCSKLPIDTFLTSGMPRARETAEIITERIGKRSEIVKEFEERRINTQLFGKKRGDQPADWASDERYAEPFEDLRIRAGRALDFLTMHAGSNILVVTHGFFLRTLFCRLIFGEMMSAADLQKFMRVVPSTENSHISIFRYNEHNTQSPWRVWVWNDHAHLG